MIGKMIQLKAADGHSFDCYRAEPQGRARGAIIVAMEIFGVNRHIQSVCDGFAADGYLALAPQFYDRVERGVSLGYGGDDFQKGRDLRAKIKWEWVQADLGAAVQASAAAGKVGVVGYCYGGGVAHMAACRVPGVAATVGYYGGAWAELVGETPQCPAMLQFAAQDKLVPVTLADEYRRRHPGMAIHVYDADHGFICEERPMYDAYAHQLARTRTMAWFQATLD